MMTDPDPGGPKTYGSTTLIAANIKKCGNRKELQEVEQQPVKIPNLNQ
jgi:hypothetical protein